MKSFWDLTAQPGRMVFADLDRSWPRFWPLIHCFYASLLYFGCANFYTSVERYAALTLDPLWPLLWIQWIPTLTGIHIVLLLFVFGPLLAAWNPRSAFFRILAFLGCLMGMALDNSFGKINNHLHLWTMAAFCFVFLPGEKSLAREEGRLAALRLFWGAQSLILLTYTMSGISKILGLLLQLYRHQEHTLLSHESLARIVAEQLILTSERSLFGSWIIYHPWAGWPFHLGAVYLEIFALLIAFRPALQRAWAMGLVFMHVGIFLAMNVTFATSILLLTLLFAAGPLNSAPLFSKQALRDIPWFGPLLATLWDIRPRFGSSPKGKSMPRVEKDSLKPLMADGTTIVFYDGDCRVCNRWIRILLSLPLPEEVRFAPIQSKYFRELAIRYPVLSKVDSMMHYRRESDGETLLLRSEGIFWFLARIPGWPRWSVLALLLPLPLLDAGYWVLAKTRHRLGRNWACPLISLEQQKRFLPA